MAARHWWLYVLKLEQDKWYVGITSKTPKHRFLQHIHGFAGANWTRKYHPLEIHDKHYLGEVPLGQAQAYENTVTREYIRKYGIDNVRGGDITSTSKLVERFGYFMDLDSLQNIAYVCALLGIIALLALLLAVKP